MFVLDKGNSIHFYDNFLNDDVVYHALESYWMKIFFMWLDTENINSSDWISPFYKTTFSNGKKMMDGNPIFSAKSRKDGRIIRVIQEDPIDGDVFTSWRNSTADSKGILNELVIVCTLNSHNLEKVKKIIISWIVE
ncbi:hypothetical protein [Solibacillus sp. FSL K6-1523]|uniref:hypothetical protein n=1 Tax=Solibacillus sp. FSL K6-1523 TaxID=2921471 RepID=UPI0030F54BCA